jgi:hypothetical protein
VSDKREVGNTVVLPVETFQLQVSWPNAFKYLEVAFLPFLAIFMAVFSHFGNLWQIWQFHSILAIFGNFIAF